ncbi:RNA polymerase sigma factor [Rossellomorea oryzaecorticis]|uniref:RNA polymerase sigma factor n=1 Tax=Rossellomorea oryzaecorticis TaxID=1396505 RepID=A0ABW8VRS4_9BACI
MIDLDDLEGSISELYKVYHLEVYKFLICFCANQIDAEDLTQEVFIRVLNNLSSYNQQSSIKTWIFSIAKHAAIDHHRKKKFVTFFKDGFFKNIESEAKQPDEWLEEQDIKRVVHDAISRLKPHFRAVVILRGINECSIKETSEILQCSESKVKVSYHRALKELRRKLNVEGEEALRNAK